MPLIRVFDLGGVLLLFDDERFYRKVRPHCGADSDLRAALAEHYDRTGVDRDRDFANFYRAAERELGLRMPYDAFEHAWNDIFTSNPPMLELVRNSPRPRYLLSNTNQPHVTWIWERYPDLFPLFDACVLSNEVGLRKPDAAIYRHVESLSGAPPDHHVFIDDVPDYAEGARAVGWHAIQFRGIDDCLQRLDALDADA